MKKYLIFRYVAFDTRTISPGPHWTNFFTDDDRPSINNVTTTGEEEIIRWVLRSPAKGLFLSELRIASSPFTAYSIKKPLIDNPQKKPGDIDLLVCDPLAPNLATAFQCKRVKVVAEGPDQDKVNKLEKLGDAVDQANGTRDLGFHRTYLIVLIGVDGRGRRPIPVHERVAGRGAFRRVYDFPQRGSLHEDVGVVFIEISQPTGSSIDDTAIVAISVDHEAACLEQSAKMTERVKELMLMAGAS